MNGAGSENFLPPAGARVAVGMSGGVDSSMAAWLLKRRGCEVIGLTMSIWDGTIPLPGGGRSGCFGPGEEGRIAAARRMAERLGIAHHIIRLAPEYRHEVIGYFRRAYLAGRTPNPCARCNREIKCRQLPERARAEGLGVECKVGWFTRVERSLLTIIALIAGVMPYALWVLMVGTWFTSGQRMWHVYRTVRDEPLA